MSKDKTQENIGKIHREDLERDAIHIAVFQAETHVKVLPGQPVKLSSGKRGHRVEPAERHEAVGVVDPYLRTSPEKHEKFFVFLIPGTAIGLRHEYIHPVLDSGRIETKKNLARSWIEEHAEFLGAPFETADKLIAHAESCRYDGGDFYTEYDTEHKRDGFQSVKFWEAYEVLTGKPPPGDEEYVTMFNCSC